MHIRKLAAWSLGAAALLAAAPVLAKDVKVAENNTAYTEADVQKLAATAVSMGVKEPVKLKLHNGSLTVSGSTATQCVIQVGSGSAPKITGINCQ